MLLRKAAWTALVVVAAVGVQPVQAQSARWMAHTSLREITALSVSDEALWAGTTGGVFRYQPATGEVQRYSIVEGLHAIRVQALTYDAACGQEGCVWIGYQDGVLDRLEVGSGRVRTFRDIERAERFSMRHINRLVVHGDSLLVATAFGVVVFDKVRLEVRDTYDQLGSIPPATPVHDVAVAPLPNGTPGLWLATDQGVAYASLRAVNLKDPTAWTVEQTGLSPAEVWSIAPFQGRLYVGAGVDLAVRDAAGGYQRLGLTGGVIRDLFAAPDRLIGAGPGGLVLVEAAGTARRMGGVQQASGIVQGPEGHLWFGDPLEGLVQAEQPSPQATELMLLQTFYPEGPYHSLFRQLAFDKAGNLWAAGVLAPGAGFYKLGRDGRWVDFIGSRVEVLEGRAAFTTIHAAGGGSVWAGSEGHGLAQVTPEGEVHVYDRHHSTLRGAESANNPDYLLVGGIGSDAAGDVWVTNVDAPQPLHVRSADGTWTALPLQECGGLTSVSASYRTLFIDTFGQKWITVVSKASLNRTLGLMVLNTGSTPADSRDDVCQFFGSAGRGGEGLPSVEVNALAEDRDGLIWIGTDKGLAYIVNQGLAAVDPNTRPVWPQYADRSEGVYLFQGLKINDLAVDPANRLWVATDQGAWLIRQAGGGYEVQAHFNTDNSPLFSNGVVAVAVDGYTGMVYFSTEQGLVSYHGEAIFPAEQKRDLLVYPNPVRPAEGVLPAIFIEGLVDETEVMIVAPHGEVVTRFPARGGRARWDGLDRNSQPVPSGVYLVVAVGQNGEGAAYGKVAVIR